MDSHSDQSGGSVRVVTGGDEAPGPATWRTRCGVVGLLVAAGLLYGWNVTVNQMANPFYAAATWAGTRSWKALLFGSVDPANFITVDKPPLSQWIMGLSGRLFGFSAASMLIPEVVMGVASVALMYAIGSRLAGRLAGFLAGIALLSIPVADLMFRYNNPDAAMVLCMLMGVYATVRAARRGSCGWLALAGCAMGAAFLAKMLEGWMCLPALGVFYALVTPVTRRRAVWHLAVATGAMVLSAGWYVVLTLVWPAARRPYLAGSTNNTFLDLVLGYNGVARVQGSAGSAHRGAGTAGRTGAGEQLMRPVTGIANQQWGARGGASAGPARLFHGEFGLEIGWLIPAALVALVCVLILRRGRVRTDMIRGGALLGGVWLVVNGAVLSFMQGTTHAYYTLSIAPAIALVLGIGAATAWTARDCAAGRRSMAAMTLSAAGFSAWMLDTQTRGWAHGLAGAVAGSGLVVSVALLIAAPRLVTRPLAGMLGIAAVLSGLAAPVAVAVNADRMAHTGGSPSVAPRPSSGLQVAPGGARRQSDSAERGHRSGGSRASGSATQASAAASGGFARGDVDNPQLDVLLRRSDATWPAAVSGTSAASTLELQARVAVMGIGGFTGSDPAPTLEQFKADVAAHRIGYYVIPSATGRQPSATPDAAGRPRQRTDSVQAQIEQWVIATHTAQHIGTATVYDLTTGH